jgi:iron-sulfur cluster insertion protein
METNTTQEAPFSLSPSAVRRLREVLSPESGAAPGAGLRVAVLAGGCQGFQYRFNIEPTAAEDDVIIERDGVRVFIDPVSLTLLAGAELDYAEELIGAYFRVRNPNAASSCGCGSSFAPA